jgi:hypothetical protein
LKARTIVHGDKDSIMMNKKHALGRRSCRPASLCFLAGLAFSCGHPGYDGDDLAALEEPSICGGVVDWQDVESYDGSLGPTEAFVAARERPVGIALPSGCSGTLIGPNLFLTAGHCIPGVSWVEFNFQLDQGGNPRTTDAYDVTEVLEDDVGGVDYAVLRLEGDPGSVWGTSVPAVFGPKAGEAITIIQHPGGIPKVVEGGTLGFSVAGKMTYGDLDTENGSSGSGILQNLTHYVIGVHTTGAAGDACTASNPNSGQPMEWIWAQSPVIRERALDAAKVVVLM